MSSDLLNRLWLIATFLIIIFILISGILIIVNRDKGRSIIISNNQPAELRGEIFIEGAIKNPGTYPLKQGDSFDSIIQAAGGIQYNADLSRIHVFIPPIEETIQPQKVDINRAEVWLLQALPGIGEIRAQAIIEYRNQNGLFRSFEDLAKVPGIGDSTLRKIEQYITLTQD